MIFTNQMFVRFTDESWVICDFIRFCGFSKLNNGLIAQQFVLEGISPVFGGKREKEVLGSEIVEITPVHRTPLLVTYWYEGEYYEGIINDLGCYDSSSPSSNSNMTFCQRYLVEYVQQQSFYKESVDIAPSQLNGEGTIMSAVKRFRRSLTEFPTYVFSIEPYYIQYQAIDIIARNKRPAPSRVATSIDSSSFLLIVNKCYKRVSVEADVDISYSTRNFDVTEIDSVSYCFHLSTRKQCREYLESLFKRIEEHNRLSLEKKEINEQEEQYVIRSTDDRLLINIPTLLGVHDLRFQHKVSSSSNWNW